MSVLWAGKNAASALGIFCAAVSCALSAAPVRAQQTAFPVSSATPVPFAAPSGFVEYATEAAYSLPVSRVRQDAKGNTDSTDAVNFITAVPPFPVNGAAPAALWLGTQYGIKHVSGETVRYYLPEEGLPGRYVEAISGDDKAAFALVRVPWSGEETRGSRLAFCVWDNKTDKWRAAYEMGEVLPDRYFDSRRFDYSVSRGVPLDAREQEGKSAVVQSAGFAAFAPGVVSVDDALAYLWDKKTQQVRPLSWEPSLEAKASGYVGVSFLFLDEARQTLWVGTSQGLLAYDLARQTWRTVLSGQVISAGAASPDGSALYVTRRPPTVVPARSVSNAMPAATAYSPVWRLVRLDLASGDTAEMPAPSAVPKADPYVFQLLPGTIDPAGLFAEAGAVWATVVPVSPGRSDGTGNLHRFDTVSQQWETLSLGAPRNLTRPVLQRLDIVPDAVLRPLTVENDPSRQYTADSNRNETAYYVLHRFPRWYGANDDAAQAFIRPQTAPTYDVPDVAAKGKQTGSVWFVQGDTLKRKTANAVETFPLQATVTTQSFPVYRVVPAGPANLNTVLVQTSQAVYAVDTRTSRWTALNLGDEGTSVTADGETALLPAEKGRGPFFQTTHNGDRKVITWNPAYQTFDTQSALALPRESRVLGPGENGGLWLTQGSRADVFYQAAPSAPGAPAPAPVLVVPPKPGEFPLAPFNDWSKNAPTAFGASGNTLWYKLYSKEGYFPRDLFRGYTSPPPTPNVLAGYNRVTGKWTRPLLLPENFGERVPLLTQNGVTYAATNTDNGNGCVWELMGENSDTAAPSWRMVAPWLPPEAGVYTGPPYPRSVVPVSVSKTEVWVLMTGRMMARYNRVAQKWDTFLLPPALRDSPQISYSEARAPRAVQIAPNTFCLSSATGGLWRFEAGETGKSPVVWTAIQPQTTLQSRVGNGPSAFSFGGLTVTPQYVWATGYLHTGQFSFAARMDKKTHEWKLWDEASGLPTQGVDGVTADGDAVWVTAKSGVYRLDNAGRATLLVRGASPEEARVPEAARVYTGYKGKEIVGDVSQITSDDASIYLWFVRSPGSAGPENALLWRWNRAAKTFAPLPIPANLSPVNATGYRRFDRLLLNEPEALWTGTGDSVLVWSKTRQAWSRLLYPAGIPFAPPSRIVRSGNDLVLVQNTFGFSGMVSHVIRIAAPAVVSAGPAGSAGR